MLVNEYISKDFPEVKDSQTVEYALMQIENYNLTHIAVFQGVEFMGNLSKETLEENSPQMKLSELKEFYELFSIDENASLLDAVQLYHNNLANVLAVLNQKHHFVGFLMLDDVMSGFSAMPFVTEPGSILIVEISNKKLSFSEISKIVESNNARIIGMFVTAYKDEDARVTIKLSAENLTSVVETFDRFDYNVVYKSFSDEKDELMKDRFEQLMKYLNG